MLGQIQNRFRKTTFKSMFVSLMSLSVSLPAPVSFADAKDQNPNLNKKNHSQIMSFEEFRSFLARGVPAEQTMQALNQIFRSPEDKKFLGQLQKQIQQSRPAVFQIPEVLHKGDRIEFHLKGGRKIRIQKKSEDLVFVNGQPLKIAGASARDTFVKLRRILSSSLTVAEFQPTGPWWVGFIGWVLPEAQAFEPTSTFVGGLIISMFALGYGAKWLWVNWPSKNENPSVNDILARIKHDCNVEIKDSRLDYRQSSSFVELTTFKKHASKYVDADRFQTVGRCGPRHIEYLAKLARFEYAPEQVAEACEFLDKYLSCMKDYKDRAPGSPPVPVQSAAIQQQEAPEASR